MTSSMDDTVIGNPAPEVMDPKHNRAEDQSGVDSEGEKLQRLQIGPRDEHTCSDYTVNDTPCQVIVNEHDNQDETNNAGNVGGEDFKEGDNAKVEDLETSEDKEVTNGCKEGDSGDEDCKQEDLRNVEAPETRDYSDHSEEVKRENAGEATNEWNNVGWGEEFKDEDNVKEGKSNEEPTNGWNEGDEEAKAEDSRNVDVSETGEHYYPDPYGKFKRKNGASWGNRGGFVRLPVRMGAEDCAFYMKTGSCKFGSGCKFNHPPRGIQFTRDFRGSKLGCKFHFRPEGCRFGDSCKFLHSNDKPSPSQSNPPEFNSFGLPIRHGEKQCSYYMRNGSCKFGSTCRFHHPDFSVAVKTESPSKPLTNTASYEPVHIKNGVQNDKEESNPDENGCEFPERPEEPECSHFVKTGYCKFKSSCKFHHPKNLSSCALSEKGLPLRPDQNVCAFYERYGICKFGPSCRFNHPIQPYSV